MNLPVGETLHITHALVQIVRGMLAGNNQQSQNRSDRCWKKHVFATKDDSGKDKNIQTFVRVELQDGSRKEGTKRYDGSGRPHLHVLFFADGEALAAAKLEKYLFATMPTNFSEHLKGYIAGSQTDKYGDSGMWPIYDGEVGYNTTCDTLLLKHTAEDHENGFRAYCVDLMDALPCHQDWQVSDGEALLLQYVSKYVAKFSDSSYDEWMNDHASADSVARRVCFEYHPYEPEMILQLCGAQLRQYDTSTVSGGFKTVMAPWVGMEEVPVFVKNYMNCTWRQEEMCLLQWLRKTKDEGEIAGWLKTKHKNHMYHAAYKHECRTASTSEPKTKTTFRKAVLKDYSEHVENEAKRALAEPMTFVDYVTHVYVIGKNANREDFPTLEEFANAYIMKGEKIVSVEMVYELNVKYYGQWVAMNVPFRTLDDFRDEEIDRLVPRKYKYIATALKLCADRSRVPEELHNFFQEASKFGKYMKAAAKTDKFIADVQRLITGQRKLIDMYLTGVLDKNDENNVAHEDACMSNNRRKARDGARHVVYNRKQQVFENAINERVDCAMRANHSEDWEAADEAREEAEKLAKPIICLGKAGTGKSTVVKSCIRRAKKAGARVLFALPTAQLASRMKEALLDLEGVEITTCHAAFKLNEPITEALPVMTMYDLIIVNEVSLLDKVQFERLIKMWTVAEKIPALVFLGDKYQLPGVGKTCPWESAAWPKPRCFHVKLDETWRCKEEHFQRILDEIRSSKPSKHTLQVICRGKKAWKKGEPTAADLKILYERHPNTQIVTCTRHGAAAVNEAAVAALFGKKSPLATLPGDVDVNPVNYCDGKFREDRQPVPSNIPVQRGMKLYLTKNIGMEDDFVNGMLCVLENYHAAENMLRVKTKTGHRLAVTRWTDREKQNAIYFPIRCGYASKIDKVQGDDFEHITVYLDGRPRPAAGYTALSRVATSDCYLLGGHVTRDHFIPAF